VAQRAPHRRAACRPVTRGRCARKVAGFFCCYQLVPGGLRASIGDLPLVFARPVGGTISPDFHAKARFFRQGFLVGERGALARRAKEIGESGGRGREERATVPRRDHSPRKPQLTALGSGVTWRTRCSDPRPRLRLAYHPADFARRIVIYKLIYQCGASQVGSVLRAFFHPFTARPGIDPEPPGQIIR